VNLCFRVVLIAASCCAFSAPAFPARASKDLVHAQMVPNDSGYDFQWDYTSSTMDLGAESVWDLNHSADNIKIALIDSGADLTHEDIAPNLWKNPGEIPGNGIDDDGNGYVDDVVGYDFTNKDSDPSDDNGHGTMVFGIIAAAGNNGKGVTGMVWNAQVLVLKVLDSTGNANISTTVEAIDYAIAQKVQIINLSWGYIPDGSPAPSLEAALQRAQDAGILVVTSAGNTFGASSGSDNDQDPNFANYPSSFPEKNIIAVAATNQADDLASFSNYGATTVDLGAPGEGIYTTAPGNTYEYFEGTSAAAPLVTGAAALIWSANPNFDYQDVKNLLLENVDPRPSLEGKTVSGGRLNVLNAFRASPAGGSLQPEKQSNLPAPSSGSSGGGCVLQKSNTSNSASLVLAMLLFQSGYLLFLRRIKKTHRAKAKYN